MFITDKAGQPVPVLQVQAIHEQDQEGGPHVGVKEEGKEIRHWQQGHVERRQENLGRIRVLKTRSILKSKCNYR